MSVNLVILSQPLHRLYTSSLNLGPSTSPITITSLASALRHPPRPSAFVYVVLMFTTFENLLHLLILANDLLSSYIVSCLATAGRERKK